MDNSVKPACPLPLLLSSEPHLATQIYCVAEMTISPSNQFDTVVISMDFA
jgi:hypothetical protein